jgi:hypothetical protein
MIYPSQTTETHGFGISVLLPFASTHRYVRVLKIVQKARPSVVFVLENVYGMPAADRDIITKALGVTPVRLRACEISACKRDRFVICPCASA